MVEYSNPVNGIYQVMVIDLCCEQVRLLYSRQHRALWCV